MRVYLPLGKRVIVEVLPFEEKISEGGVVIATDAHVGMQAPRLRGKILKVGKGVEYVAIDDVVNFEPGAGVPLDFTKPDIVWMEEEQIVSIEQEG